MKHVLYALLLVGWLTPQVMADVISGELTFTKKPPFTGILYVEGTGSSAKSPLVDQKDKAFTTKIAVGAPSNDIKFKNSDTFDHNIYANDSKQKVKFDVGLMTPGNDISMTMDWPQDTLVRIGCKIHPKMRGYIANVNSDHYHAFDFQKKVKSYKFSIEGVPGSADKVVLLMPKYDTQTITLAKGQTQTVDVTRKGKVRATLTLTRK